MYDSGPKGKTMKQVLVKFLPDDLIKNDPEVQQLDMLGQLKASEELKSTLREWNEKKVPMWRYQTYKAPGWGALLDEIDELETKWQTAIEETQQLVNIIRDTHLGLKKSGTQQRRQDSHKTTNAAKVLKAGGFGDSVCRAFSKAYNNVVDKVGAGGGEFSLSAKVFHLNQADEGPVRQHLRGFAKDEDGNIASAAMALASQIKSNSIMKPLSFDAKPPENHSLDVPLNSDVPRPWLIVSPACSACWAPLRYPIMGLPSYLCALDSYTVVGLIVMEEVLSAGLSMDTMDWFGEGGKKLSVSSLDIVVLQKGVILRVPPFTCVLHAFVPADLDKTVRGKMLVQCALEAASTINTQGFGLALNELKHSFSKMMAVHGDKRPWFAVKAGATAWLEKLTT